MSETVNDYLKFEEMFARLCAGDEFAFNDIYSATRDHVAKVARDYYYTKLGWAREYDCAEDFVEEVVNDTYFQLSRYFRSIKEPRTVPSWLSQTAIRICYAKTRALRPDVVSLESVRAEETIPAEEDFNKELVFESIVRDHVTLLQYMTMRLIAIDEMSYEEAAEVLGCPVGTVKSRVNAARKTLGNLDRNAEKGGREAA